MVLCAEGETPVDEAAVLDGGGSSVEKEDLPWGAGEGAMATAALMLTSRQ